MGSTDGSWRTDEAAFAGLVRRWQRPIARFLQRVVADEDRVQDLCQDVFLRVYLARERYRETDAFSTWLFQIALNTARDALRRRRRDGQPLHTIEPLVDESPGLACEQRETALVVAEAVAALPASLREVLALRHDQGMNFEQISRVLGVPASTLKSRFATALHRLRDQLAALGPQLEEK